jgi:lipopolysaccharide export system protein LptA
MDLNSDTPIHVSAEKMVSHNTEKAVVFSGNVQAKQGDLIINSQTMTIYHGGKKTETNTKTNSPAANNAEQIKKIIATGNVEIIQEGFVATGDKVEYLAAEEKVLLTGHAKIIQDNNMVTGYQVEMDLAKGTTTVTPEKGADATSPSTNPETKPKVEMYFYPKTDKNK